MLACGFLVRGEGDFAFGELLDSIAADGQGMDDILGLSYKDGGVFRHNAARPLEDLTRISIPLATNAWSTVSHVLPQGRRH